MKKRILSAVLAMLLVIGIAVPVWADDDDTTPTHITLSPSTLTLYTGSVSGIRASVSPLGADDNVSWESNNDSVASVSDGIVTAHSAGSAIITASTSNGLTATCRVTVRDSGSSEPTRISLSSTSMILYTGTLREIKATISPSGADGSVSWRSDNPSVAEVSDGYVLAVSAGTANIYATTSNGLTTTCRVTVRTSGAEVEATKVEMSLSKMNVRVDQTRQLWVLFTPTDSTEKSKISWTSSNTNVAKVDPNGVVTGVAPGTATITAKTAKASTTCQVTVSGSVVSGLNKDVSETTADTATAGEKLTSSDAAATVKEALANTAKGKTATASFTNKTSISKATINAAVFAAYEADRDVQLRFVTTDDNGKTQGSFVFDPTKVTDREADLKTSVYLNSKNVQTAKSRVAAAYKNDVVVLEIAETGDLGITAQIAAKVNMDGMNLTNLRFYTYNASSNRYDPLEIVGKAKEDANGYLRFATTKGGVIVVSDGELKAR